MITQFKIFENTTEHQFKVGDYVYAKKDGIEDTPFDEDVKYEIVDIYNLSLPKKSRSDFSDNFHNACTVVEVENRNKVHSQYYLKRFITEVEYDAKKYNL